MIHEERLNNSFLEEINSIVLQEGQLHNTAQNQALLKNRQCNIMVQTIQSPTSSIVELIEQVDHKPPQLIKVREEKID